MAKTTNGPASSTDTEHQYVESEDVIETSTEQPKNVEIRPDFFTMDEGGVKEYARELTNWIRDRGATVRGPKSLTVVAEEPAKDSKKKASVANDEESKGDDKSAKPKKGVTTNRPVDSTDPLATTSDEDNTDKTPDKPEQVYEWSYEWEYDPQQVVTIRFVANNDLDALRGCIDEAFHKRWTVG